MAYEIFISYLREDEKLCDELIEILEEDLEYKGKVFVDRRDMAAGMSWRDQIMAVLGQQDAIKPYVLLVATRSAAADPNPDGIRAELQTAATQGLDVIAVEFDPGAARELLGSGKAHYIEARRSTQPRRGDHRRRLERLIPAISWSRPEGTAAQVQERRKLETGDLIADRASLVRKLLTSLNYRTKVKLDNYRAAAQSWSRMRCPRSGESFWEGAVPQYFPPGQSVVLTGVGGAGKSVLMALYLRDLLAADPGAYPVLVGGSQFQAGMPALARELGAHDLSELPGHVQALALNHNQRIVFVVDGLDQIAVPGDPKREGLADALTLMASSGQLIVGCRDGVWEHSFAGRVAVSRQQVRKLDRAQITAVLDEYPHLRDLAGTELFKIPYFLNQVVRKAAVWEEIPTSDVKFLTRLLEDAQSDRLSSSWRHRRTILRSLAELQLAALSYDIPIDALKGKCNLPADLFDAALAGLIDIDLVSARPVRAWQPAGGSTIRLNHDLIDSFNMSRLLIEDRDERDQKLANLFEQCSRDCGWTVLSMAVLLADHENDGLLQRKIFAEILAILDRKPMAEDGQMARAWAVTYVLQERVLLLLPLILECLGGTSIDDLDPRATSTPAEPLSRLGPDPRLTPAAASTIAAAFLDIPSDKATLSDARVAVPLLEAGLYKWKYRARFIDALARYSTAAASNAIIEFGQRQLEVRDDLGCLLYVAQALKGRDARAARALLEQIRDDPDSDPVVVRRAHESLASMVTGYAEPVRTDIEIIFGLRTRDGQGRYTDWRVVEEYALYILAETDNGRRFGPGVGAALIKALDHTMTAVRQPVAAALGCFDDLSARDALLDELLSTVVATNLREACISSLERQLGRIDQPRDRQGFRYLLLRAAYAADRANNLATASRLTDLAVTESTRDGDWLTDRQALEVIPPPAVTRARSNVAIARQPPPVDSAIAAVLRQMDQADVGKNREPKYRFTQLSRIRDSGALQARLATSTWTDGQRFHQAALSEPLSMSRSAAGSWAVPAPLGTILVPGIVSVHVVVLTNDGQLLMAQRPHDATYAPGHWSASFEEQLTATDFAGEADCFATAACRGFLEEFGCAASPAQATVLTAIFEIDIMNLAVIVALRPDIGIEQIRNNWETEPRPRDFKEVIGISALPGEPSSLNLMAAGNDQRFSPLHPTSRIRCAAALRTMTA